MDEKQVAQRIIGLVTWMHDQVHTTTTGSDPEDGTPDLIKLLLDDAFVAGLEFRGVPAGSEELVQQVADSVATVLAERNKWLINAFARIFVEIISAYERDYPAADIPGILQNLALEIATE